MFAVILDENNYIKSYSKKYRTQGSILSASIPNETDPDKLKCYKYVKKKFVLDADKWEEVKAKREKENHIKETMQSIDSLKTTLSDSDYKFIKCLEYSLNNLEMPYDVETLHAERQALRDQINELEKELNNKI